MKTRDLRLYLDSELDVRRFSDYCPNGLQVQGGDELSSILCATTANLELCQMAAERGFDAILCHHGFFWKSDPRELVGASRERIKTLLDAGINLFAYHLPLDTHRQWGNNVALAEHLGWQVDGFADAGGVSDLICLGRPGQAQTAAELIASIGQKLDREPLAVGRERRRDDPVERLAWCTGAAQGFLAEAAGQGADAYISGEISLANTDYAREADILYISAGHHATERYGVRKLGGHLAEKFGIRVEYQEQDNPV